MGSNVLPAIILIVNAINFTESQRINCYDDLRELELQAPTLQQIGMGTGGNAIKVR